MKTAKIYEVTDELGINTYFATKKEAAKYYKQCQRRYDQNANRALLYLPTFNVSRWEISKKQIIKLLNQ